MAAKPKWTRGQILELPELGHIKEALQLGAEVAVQRGQPYDIMRPIRETPLSVFYDKGEGSFESERLNPYLPNIWFSKYGLRIGDIAKTNPYIGGKPLRETVSIPNTLSALKIADEVLEGAEPWSDWKQYARLIEMDTPKVNVPLTKYTDTVGGSISDQKGLEIYVEAGGTPPAIGGKVTTTELDTSGTNNSYRGTLAVNRNDVKDNNFLTVEQSLKNAGNEFYFMVGEKIIRNLTSSGNVPSADASALAAATPAHVQFEAMIEVIRGRFPGSQRNRADTMFIHPSDAALAVKTVAATAAGVGEYPLLSRFTVGPTDNTDVVNNSGLAMALGLRNVWETPQITQDTVLITKRDIAQVVGLREDLTIENFDLSVGGLYESDLLIRVDVKEAHSDVGAFLITDFDNV